MKPIRKQLGLTTCALLSQSASALEAVDNAWEIDSTILHYSEVDRISVTKAVATVKGVISDDDSVTLKTVYDTMSGATPSGTVINKQGNISFTGASGGGVATSGKVDSLAKFSDTRIALSLDWDHAASRDLSYLFNGAISVENDYRSFSIGTTLKREFNNKTLTLTGGLAGTYDQIFRVGSGDTPGQLTLVTDQVTFGEGEKTTIDGMLGLTYVINRRTVSQFNIGASLSQGYLTDPYKLISIVDANNIEYEQYTEKRPGSRLRYTFSAHISHQEYPTNRIYQGSYRLYTDDWGITSHTFKGSINYSLGDGHYVEPNVRLYHQSAADFYRNSFVLDPPNPVLIPSTLPEYLSADYRLDESNSITLGATYGIRSSANSHLRLRLQLIHWAYANSEYGTMNVYVLQASYGKKF